MSVAITPAIRKYASRTNQRIPVVKAEKDTEHVEGSRLVVLYFPLPPNELSPNKERNGHWTKKAEATKGYRNECKDATLKQWDGRPMTTPVSMTVKYYFSRERDAPGSTGRYLPRDVFNIPRSLKALCDGMIDAGVLPDDSMEYITEATVGATRVSERAGARSIVKVTLRTN